MIGNLLTGRTVSGASTLAAAAVAALGIVYIMPGGVAAPVVLDDHATASIERTEVVWSIADDMTGARCELRPGPRLTGGQHTLTLDESCSAVFEDLSAAVVWRESLDGSIALADEAGRDLVTFGPADGYGFEAVEPRTAMLSLRRI